MCVGAKPLGAEKKNWNRYLLILVACLQNALMGGIIFGWASVDRTMLVASASEGGAALTPDETTTIFSLASGISMISSLVVGPILDHYGPRVCGVFSSSLIGLGCLIFAFSKEYYGLLLLGVCLMAFGGPGIAVSNVHISNLFFGKNQFLAMSCINGSVSLSFAVLAIMDMLWQWYAVSYRTLFGYYSILIAFGILSAFCLWPDEPFQEELNDRNDGVVALIATEKESLMTDFTTTSEISSFDMDDNDNNDDVRQVILDSYQQHQQQCHNDVEDCQQSKKNFELERCNSSNLSLKDQPFQEQLWSVRYFTVLITFLVTCFWSTFYVASITTELADLQHFDTTRQHELSQIFTFINSLGLLVSIAAGSLMDRIGIEICSILTILFGQGCVMILACWSDNYNAMILGFVLYALFRQFLYPVFIGSMISEFGFHNFGVLLGITFFISGMAQFFMGVLVQLVAGTCHDDDNNNNSEMLAVYDDHSNDFLYPNNDSNNACNPGNWEVLHMAQILSLALLLPMPIMDHLTKRELITPKTKKKHYDALS